KVSIAGMTYATALSGSDFAVTREKLLHTMQGVSLKSHAGGTWDWEAAASLYDYRRDDKRQNAASNTLPTALAGGAGTLADGRGTGWNTLSLKGTWRPGGAHVADLGLQQDSYHLSYLTSSIAGDYLSDGPGATTGDVGGRTRLRSLWAQDVWR